MHDITSNKKLFHLDYKEKQKECASDLNDLTIKMKFFE